jgi:4-amino-4-deoxy-L-arabinose transferase-like glycosyltransferase
VQASTDIPGGRRWMRTAALALILAVFPLLVFSRLRLRDTPLERDEGEYAYAGQLILQGIPPYSLACNMKLPGTYAAYAVIMAVFGQTIGGIRLGLLLVNAATVLLVFLLGRRLFSQVEGLAAAAAYALLSFGLAVMGTAAHATHFVVLPMLAGVWLLLRSIESGRALTLFWSGVLFGVAFLAKQHGIFFALFGAGWLVWKRPGGWMRTARRLAIFGAAAALPFALTCLILWAAGVFPKFWFWTFQYARAYASENTIADGISNLKDELPSLVHNTAALWALSGLGLVAAWWKRENRPAARFLAGFLICSAMAVSPGFYFRQHYFVLMLPVVALGAGVVAGAWRGWGIWLFAAALVLSVASQGYFLFRETPYQVSRELYDLNPFPEAIPIAEYMRQHSPPNATIAVLGSEPEIYFYAHRHSATGYIYTFALSEDQPYATQMRDEMIQEIKTSQPEYVVLVDSLDLWDYRSEGKPTVFSWWRGYGPRHYDIVGMADVISANRTEYRWGAAAAAYKPESDFIVAIYRKR